jgi:pyruvate formate lyase activating enzyme
MNISGIIKSSLIDYPGFISCVLFVPGCNYSCFYCHNRSLLDGTHVLLTPQYVSDFLKKRAGLLDGVVISGGEPTLQIDLVPFLEKIKELGYRIKLDTNGSRPQIIEAVLKRDLCDYVAVDYKSPAAQYPQICGAGADVGSVLKTIGLLSASGMDFEVRTTIIPQLGQSELLAMAQELPALPGYVLNRYKIPDRYLPEDEERISKPPLSMEEIQAIADEISVWQPNLRF